MEYLLLGVFLSIVLFFKKNNRWFFISDKVTKVILIG